VRDGVDLRSDTQTTRAPAVWAVMGAAEVGDDVWEQDPPVQVAVLAVGSTVIRSVTREITAGC
jgi:threonine aldolase